MSAGEHPFDRTNRMRKFCGMLLGILVLATAARGADDTMSVETPDRDLEAVIIDSASTESFLGVRVDTTGRIFVGGRSGVFVLEPNAAGGYAERRQLVSFPGDPWVYDIEIRGDDLYVLTVSALYMIPGGRVNREGLEVRRLIWGVPRGHTHQCFHGLAWGPEGDLYLGMGDPLWHFGDFRNRPDHFGHWTFFSRRPGDTALAPPTDGWERTPYTGVGGVFRCRPDGSGLRLVAGGLRNGCGLAFDHDWNLFTNDNDHESHPAAYVPGRLLHVTPHAWFSWPRGWSPDKTPERLDLLATMNPALGRFVPAGQAYYDDILLQPRYRNSLLVARWCTRQVAFYPLEHAGASFRCTEGELLAGSGVIRPVNVTVGRGGRIFATVCHMQGNEDSPIYKSDVVMITPTADTAEHPFAAYDAVSVEGPRLFEELRDPSWSRRKEAHAELLRRGDIPGSIFVKRWDQSVADSPERLHLVWLMGLRADPPVARERLAMALRDADAAIRLQAVRCLTEQFPGSIPGLRDLLADPDPQVRHAAIIACFEAQGLRDDDSIVASIIDGPAVSEDTYLRQAATLLLAQWFPADRLAAWATASAPHTRLAATLAAGFRLTLPDPIAAPPETLKLAPWNERATVVQYCDCDEKLDLRTFGRLGMFTIAGQWQSVEHSADQEHLFALLTQRLDDSSESVRLQAAAFLHLLDDPRTQSRIMTARADVERRHAERLAAVAAAAPKPGEFLDANRPAWDPAAFADVDWTQEVLKGDANRGRKLFGTGGVGCGKCHAIDDAHPVAGGPSLSAAKKRFTIGYLAESVLEPGKAVAISFRATTVVTTEGRSFTGLLSGETAEALELILSDATTVSIPRASIEQRLVQPVSPMPAGIVRTREELRDVLAYLLEPARAEAAPTSP